MPFDVNDLIDDLFPSDDECKGGNECLWINTREFASRTAGMTAEQVGRLLLEMVDMYKRGLMKNGPAVRIDQPVDEEATDGSNS